MSEANSIVSASSEPNLILPSKIILPVPGPESCTVKFPVMLVLEKISRVPVPLGLNSIEPFWSKFTI